MAHNKSNDCNSKWPRRLKACVWIVCVVAVLLLSPRHFIQLWTNNVEEASTVSLIGSPPQPNPVICIPYYTNALSRIEEYLISNYDRVNREDDDTQRPPVEYEAMLNHSWDVWDLDAYDYYQMFRESTAKMVNRVLDEGNGYPSLMFNESGYNWNQPIVDAVWRYLSAVTALDRRASSPRTDLGDDSTPSVRPASRDELDLLFARVAANVFLLDYLPDYGYDSYIFGTSQVTIVDHRLCFQALSSGAQDTSYTFRATRGAVKVFPNSDIIHASAQKDRVMVPLYETNLNMDPSRILTESLTLTYSAQRFTLVTDEYNTCTDDTPTICSAERQVEATVESCKCVPFAYRFIRYNSDNLPYCNRTHYESCQDTMIDTAWWSTYEYCNQECDHVIYNWMRDTTVETSNTTAVDGRSFLIRLQPLSSSYPVFRTTPDRTNPASLFSQFGGLIAFFGFGVLIIAGLINSGIDCISICYRKVTRFVPLSHAPAQAWTTNSSTHVLVNGLGDDQKVLVNRYDQKVTVNGLEDDQKDKMREEMDQLKRELDAMRKEISLIGVCQGEDGK